MYNVILTMLTLFAGALPEQTVSDSGSDPILAAAFRQTPDRPILNLLERPSWLVGTDRKNDGMVVRGQNGGTFETPPIGAPLGQQPMQYDPFQQGQDPVLPYLNTPPQTILSGINGPQPHRFGFTPLFDSAYITPSSAKSPGKGHMSIQEYDVGLRYTSMLGADWVISHTAQGGARVWDGPDKPDLPGSVFRAGWDFLLHSPSAGPFSAQLEFNPSINSDFQSTIQRQAINFDGGVTGFYQAAPDLMLVLGVLYWDRVDKLILPNVGVVWNPTQRLEMRLLFPKSRISYFLGNFGDGAHWLYATGEYHVESYQISTPAAAHEQVQLSDWRVGVGLRSDHTWYDKYVEVGYVFGRQVDFLRKSPDFDMAGGIMARLGVRF